MPRGFEDSFESLPRGSTQLPNRIRRSYPFRLDDGGEECLVDKWGNRHCQHDHSLPEEFQLQDVYEHVPGWTAQS